MSTAERAYRDAAAGDQTEQLVTGNLHLVRHVLGRVAASLPSGVDRENLEGAGMVGLVEAARRFDAAKGSFESFARRRIRGAMLDELRRNSQLPQAVMERLKAIGQARQQLPAPASIEEVASQAGMTVGQVVETLQAARSTRIESGHPLDEVARRHDGQADGSPADRADKQELLDALAAAIQQLPERQRLVVTMYYLEDLRLVEIGEVLRLNPGTVSRVLAEAEHQLGELLREWAND